MRRGHSHRAPRRSPETPRPFPRRVAGLGVGAPCGEPAQGGRVRSGADRIGRVFEVAAAGQGNAGQFRKRLVGRRQRVADSAFDPRIAPVETGTETGRRAQVPGRRENAEEAVAPRQVMVDSMRRLAGVSDDAEHIVGGRIEDRQPVEDLAAGDAHALVAPPGDAPGANGALVAPDTEAVHQRPAEARMGLQIPSQLALDRSALMLRGTPFFPNSRKFSAFLDAVKPQLAGRDGRENQAGADRQGPLDMLDRARTFDVAQRRMNGEQTVAENDSGQRTAIVWPSLPPPVEDETRAPVRVMSRHAGGMRMSAGWGDINGSPGWRRRRSLPDPPLQPEEAASTPLRRATVRRVMSR